MCTACQWHLRAILQYEVLKQRMGAASAPPHTIIGVGPPDLEMMIRPRPTVGPDVHCMPGFFVCGIRNFSGKMGKIDFVQAALMLLQQAWVLSTLSNTCSNSNLCTFQQTYASISVQAYLDPRWGQICTACQWHLRAILRYEVLMQRTGAASAPSHHSWCGAAKPRDEN